MKITKRQLRRIIKEVRSDAPYEEMIQAINANLDEALAYPPFAKYIYQEMVNGGWIE